MHQYITFIQLGKVVWEDCIKRYTIYFNTPKYNKLLKYFQEF